MILASKTGWTSFTLEYLCFFQMRVFVNFDLRLGKKMFVTCVALVWFLVGMAALVAVKTIVSTITQWTLVTFEYFLLGMSELVTSKSRCVGKTLVTLVTLVRFFSCMDSFMFYQL